MAVVPDDFDRVYQQWWWPMFRLAIGLVDTAAAAALSRLPSRQREVLVMRYIAELPDAEIGAALSLSEPGVRSAASRGLG